MVPGFRVERKSLDFQSSASTTYATQAYSIFCCQSTIGISRGADNQSRTGDLILTKDALYLLSYISITIAVTSAIGIVSATEPLLSYISMTIAKHRYCNDCVRQIAYELYQQLILAERVGLEPTRRFRPNSLANCPLNHLSTSPYGDNGEIRTHGHGVAVRCLGHLTTLSLAENIGLEPIRRSSRLLDDFQSSAFPIRLNSPYW